jgi:NurA domain
MLTIMNNNICPGPSCCEIKIDAIVKSITKHCFSLGISKLRKGQRVLFEVDGNGIQSLDRRPNRYNPYCASPITIIKPIRTMTSIYAIDSSSVRLGDTDDGSIYAVKCGIATASDCHALHHYKIGPIIFYVNDDTVRESELDHKLANIVLSDHESAKRLTRVRTERSIQCELSRIVNNSIILVDGSLIASPLESSQHSIKKIVEYCCANKNSLIGITKKTNLNNIKSICSFLTEYRSPAYMDLVHMKGLIGDPIGNNTLVKFGENDSPILRVDIVDPEKKIDIAFGKLLGNDSVSLGYPESLRLAHHISTFNRTEIECLKGHLLSEYRLQVVPPDDIRSILLGSMSI